MASSGTARTRQSCMRRSSADVSAPRAMSGWLVTTTASKSARRRASTAAHAPGRTANSASARGDTARPSRRTSRVSTPSLSRNTARRMGTFLFRAGTNPVRQAKRHQVVQHDVERLDVRRGVVGHHNAYVGQVLHRAADVCVDRKSTRLNSSHSQISYAVFCLKKKKKNKKRELHTNKKQKKKQNNK